MPLSHSVCRLIYYKWTGCFSADKGMRSSFFLLLVFFSDDECGVRERKWGFLKLAKLLTSSFFLLSPPSDPQQHHRRHEGHYILGLILGGNEKVAITLKADITRGISLSSCETVWTVVKTTSLLFLPEQRPLPHPQLIRMELLPSSPLSKLPQVRWTPQIPNSADFPGGSWNLWMLSA